ncbi:MAG: TIGR00730 family Rossman fold protein [Mediterranea sp.]|nr:TIGR00730 family Rossman fold protein [Mediterranea sp.]
MNKIHSVCVYSASSTQIDPLYVDAAQRLGRLLGEKRIRLVNGAGNMGLMAAVADATLQAGGEAVGVIPRFMVEQGWHHTGLTELHVVNDMHERKQLMARLSDGVIALPGGCGTLEELLEIITWKQLGLYLNPIIVLNVKGYFDPLLAMLAKAVEERFMRVRHGDIWQVAATPDEAIELLFTTPLWDASIRKFAAI